ACPLHRAACRGSATRRRSPVPGRRDVWAWRLLKCPVSGRSVQWTGTPGPRDAPLGPRPRGRRAQGEDTLRPRSDDVAIAPADDGGAAVALAGQRRGGPAI